jgi:hypothetical protein
VVARPCGGGLPVRRPSSPRSDRRGSIGSGSWGAGTARTEVMRAAERMMMVVRNFMTATATLT